MSAVGEVRVVTNLPSGIMAGRVYLVLGSIIDEQRLPCISVYVLDGEYAGMRFAWRRSVVEGDELLFSEEDP